MEDTKVMIANVKEEIKKLKLEILEKLDTIDELVNKLNGNEEDD